MTFETLDYEPCPVSDEASGRVLVPRCYRARTGLARRRGLLGREGLEDGFGLLLGEGLVHMMGMSFALDLVFLDRRGRVLKVLTAKPGLLLHGHFRARQTLELPAGAAQRASIARGQQLRIGVNLRSERDALTPDGQLPASKSPVPTD